jgi:hypothetical protein
MNRKMNSLLTSLAVAFCGTLLSGVPPAAHADEILDVNINTSSLQGQAGSELYFVLTDGSGLGDGNNTATMNGFSLGGGTAGAVDPFSTFGGVTGDMGTAVSMTDNSGTGVNEFGQLFSPGTNLAFTLDVTGNVDGAIPDGMFAYLSDPNGNFLPTSDPSGQNSLFAITFDSATPAVTNYDSALLSIASPAVGSVPEPDSASVMAAGLVLLGGWLGLARTRRRPSA